MRAEQKSAYPAFTRPQGKSPAGREIIYSFVIKRAGDNGDSTAVECFFHRPEKIALMAKLQSGDQGGVDANPDKPRRMQRQRVRPRQLAPDNRARFRVQPPRNQGKHHAKGSGAVTIACPLYLVEGTQFQPPARQPRIKGCAAGRKTIAAGGADIPGYRGRCAQGDDRISRHVNRDLYRLTCSLFVLLLINRKTRVKQSKARTEEAAERKDMPG